MPFGVVPKKHREDENGVGKNKVRHSSFYVGLQKNNVGLRKHEPRSGAAFDVDRVCQAHEILDTEAFWTLRKPFT